MLNFINYTKQRILTIIVSFVMIIIPILFFSSNSVKAISDNSAWSWTSGEPVIHYSTPVSDIYSDSCFGSIQSMVIIGEFESKNVCMMPGNKTRFGTYISGNDSITAVGFGFDNKMYKVWGACDRNNSCLYLPGSDTLVTKQYLMTGYVRSLVVYKNFTNRLKYAVNGLSLGYNFDTSNPDYIFRSSDGYAWPVGGYGASGDGKWLAVEFRQRGIGLLNIDNLEMKRISTMAFSYGTGYDPSSELAVSNGGHTIAIMGMNSGLTIYDVNSNCGDEATDERMSGVLFITNPCKISQIDSSKFINRFYIAVHPKFSSNGGELKFYSSSYLGESRDVSLRAFGYTGQRLDYLALGDSFSSGEGETQDSYYLQGTNIEYEKCHISIRSYPYLIANLSTINPEYMKSVSCSGATTDDIIGDDIYYSGQGRRLGKGNLNLSDDDSTFAKSEAESSFLPGRIHQESFVKEYQPKVITIGIGGNDVGFMDKLKDCVGTDICSWASSAEDKEQTAIEIKNLYNTLVHTYQEIHDASPNSKVYAIGYPTVIEENGTCNLLIGKLLDSSERRFMNEGVMYINKIVEAAARQVGIGYIDVQNSFGNHGLCGSEQPSAMNAIRIGDDGSLSNDMDWLKVIGQESFHPNSIGHSYIANSIIDLVNNISSHNYCADGSIVCPSDTPAPEPSTYWIPDEKHNYPTQKIANYVYDSDISSDNHQKNVVLDNNSLAPNSSVSIEITSHPKSLGQFTTTSKGALSVSVVLPADIEQGFHTIHLYGTSYSGESVELYQVIKYLKPVEVNEDKQTNNSDDAISVVLNPESEGTDKETPNNEAIIIRSNNIDKVKADVLTSNEKKIPESIINNEGIAVGMNDESIFSTGQSVKGAFSKKSQSSLSNVNDKSYFAYSYIIISAVIGLAIAYIIYRFVFIRKTRI